MTCSDVFENCNCKIARTFTTLQELYEISSVLIANSRIFRAVVIDKTQRESEERLVETLPGACPLMLGTHWLSAVAVSVRQLPGTVNVSQK